MELLASATLVIPHTRAALKDLPEGGSIVNTTSVTAYAARDCVTAWGNHRRRRIRKHLADARAVGDTLSIISGD
jgi:hypothetical protein